MTVVLMLVWDGEGQVDPALLAGLEGVECALIHRPGPAPDQDSAPPRLAVQIEFAGIAALEVACAADGPLQRLSGTPRQQAFLLRRYPVARPDPAARCSYLVHYPGPAQDLNAWLTHYADQHIPLMCQLPAIRGVEMLTRIDHISALPFPRDHHMQRNRVSFDDPDALAVALASPIRARMRADVDAYPPYAGGVYHFAMRTEQVLPARKDQIHAL